MSSSSEKLVYIYIIFDEPKLSSKSMIAFSYSFKGFVSSVISLTLIFEIEFCSGGDLMTI